MVQLVVQKQLIVEEDIAYGAGAVSQSRGGVPVNLQKVRTIVPVSSIEELNALDTTRFTRAALFNGTTTTFYSYFSDTWNKVVVEDDPDSVVGYPKIIENVAAIATYPAIVDQVYQLKEYVAGSGNGGSLLLGKAGSPTPDNKFTFGSGSAGVYLERINLPFSSPATSGGTQNNPGTKYGGLIVGDNPMGNAGDDWPNPVGLKDAINVSRYISGEQANFHGFADKTVMDNMVDGGGYGVFDSTVKLKGAVVQDHIYSFQDRNEYAGSASIGFMAGLYSAPTHSGTGSVNWRRGSHVLDITVTGGGDVQNNVAYYAEDMVGGVFNISYMSMQTDDFSFYAGNGGRMYQKGKAGFGVDPTAFGYQVAVMGAGASAPLGFLDTDSTYGLAVGVFEDKNLSFLTNGNFRMVVRDSTTSYAVTPGADNTQPLGNGSFRWSVVHAGSGTISTSDERSKQQISEIDSAVLRAWSKVQFCQYKFNDAVESKGNGARWHFGVIAQRVKEAFDSEGIDPFAYGILCYDEWGDEFKEVQTNLHALVDETYFEEVEIVRKELKEVQVTRLVDGEKVVYIEERLVDIPTGEFSKVEKIRRVPAPPIFETVQTQVAGNRYGIRYEEALILECAYLRSKINNLS